MRVTLSPYELSMAAQVGSRRQIEALTKGLPDKHGFGGEDGWTVHIEGACGEMAVASALGRYWSGSVNTFKSGGDVGTVQVRTRSRHDYDLIVRRDDRDNDIFILVTGLAPRFEVRGWIRGADARRSEWLRTHGNRPAAYFVPQTALMPIKGGARMT